MKIKCEDCIHSDVCGIKDKEEIDCTFCIPKMNTVIVIPHKEDKNYTVTSFREVMDNKGNIFKSRFEMKNVDVTFDALYEDSFGNIFTMTIM
jgi:hypothetical protein